MANSNAASKIYICATAQNTDLTVSDYNGLSWTEITGISKLGETGKSTNILTLPTWDTTVVQKAKGTTNAGDPTLELARLPTDAGQVLLRTASAVGNNNNYAFKILRADGALGGTGTIQYNRGMVTGPTRPNGANEDFDLEVFSLALQQEEIVVNPVSSGNPPVLTAAPAITGTEQVGQVLTCSTGTFTGDATISYSYQWFSAGTAIVTGTSSTYTCTTAELGEKLQCRVMATNSVGFAYGFSDLTDVVIAA